MKKAKMFKISLFAILGALALGFLPVKASAVYNPRYNDNNYRRIAISRDYQTERRYMNFDPYFQRFQNRHFDSFATYPRTVYLIDAGNSANQLNIINATRGGSVTAAYITVDSHTYNRLVNDYNRLGVMSISTSRHGDTVTFYTVNGTYTVDPVIISFQ